MSTILNRRTFMKSSLAGMAALPALNTNLSIPSRSTDTTKIALIKTSDRNKGVTQAMKLLDLTGVNGKRVMLKPNFNSADTAPGSTHNDTLSRLVYELHERGARRITLGESSGPTNTKRVMENKGIFDMADELDFGIVNYDDISDKEWINYPEEGTHWPGGYYLPEHVVKAEYNVSTCCL